MAATGVEIMKAYVTVLTQMPGVKRDITRELSGVDADAIGAEMGSKLGAGAKKGFALAGVVGGIASELARRGVDAIANLVGEAVAASDATQKFSDTLKFAGVKPETIEKLSKSTRKYADQTVYDLADIQNMTAQLAANGVKDYDRLGQAAGNLNAVAGGNAETFKSVGMMLTQTAGAGKLTTENWNQLADAIPGASGKLQQAMLDNGAYTGNFRTAMEKGEITADEFNQAIMQLGMTDVAKEAATSTKTMEGAVGNLSATIVGGFSDAITAAKPFLTDLINTASALVQGLFHWLKENQVWLAKLAQAAGTAIAAYLGFKAVQVVVNGVKNAITLAKLAHDGWMIATRGGVGLQAASAGATTAQTFALKAGAVAQRLFTAEGWKANALWVKNTAVMVAQKTALAASTIATKGAAAAQRLFNAAMNANPIMKIISIVLLVVGAIATWMATTEEGQAVWAAFTGFLGEAWANISALFQSVWENVLKPVFEGIGQVFSFVWNSILKPIFDGIAAVAQWVFTYILLPYFQLVQFAFAVLGGIFQGIWEFILKPVFDAIAAVFTWLWETVIKIVIDLIVAYVQMWAAIFTWLWENAIKPAFDKIAEIFTWIWENVISPVIGWIQEKIGLFGLAVRLLWELYVKPAFDKIGQIFNWIWLNIIQPVIGWIQEKIGLLGLAFRIMYEQYIKPAWDSVANVIQTVWERVKSVIDTMVRVIQSDPKKAFEAARDAIGDAWSGIQELAKRPVRFVIETVINGLIGAINQLGVNIPKVPLPRGFSEGGYTGNLAPTAVAGVVHGNEHVIRAQSRMKIERYHPGVLDHMNRYGEIPGYRRGGLVNPLPKGSYSVSQPYHSGHNGIDLAAPTGTKVMAAGRGVVGLAGVVPMGGNEIYVQHANGLGTRYSHLSRFATSVGASVRPGQVIGYVGSTGMSTGPHLHYMVHNPGRGGGSYGSHVNPEAYMGVDGEAWSILDGLADWATATFKAAFPGTGMWIDAASGLMTQAVKSVVGWASGTQGSDSIGATLYDDGGWLPTGFSLVENRSRSPEPILNSSQWADIGRLADRGSGGGEGSAVFHLYDSDGVLMGTIDGRIQDAASAVSSRSLNDRLGV